MRGIDTVLIAGLSTSGCVRSAALDTLQNGFVPIVVRECVGDRHPDAHGSNLRDIAAKVGEVYSLAQASDYLTSLSGDGSSAVPA
ncbi:isochorismatase family protein [Nocardia grenadensis]|uniref:isochorismatase family protein n=1 Tax=Nocardia grenadensis TaxID=931537 RepID=UPI003D733C9F